MLVVHLTLLAGLAGFSSCRQARYITSLERAPLTPARQYLVRWFNQTLDHFSFATQRKWRQKYLVNDTWWDSNGGPIFFYTGNEGRIESFAENTGFMWDIAAEFGALLVFAEHRYYGDSLPFSQAELDTKDPAKLGLLSSAQALADYVDLLAHLRSSLAGAEDSPAVAFGGSYGGMLAAWLRTKYPHIVQGAIAGSAPIAQFTSPCDAFGRIVTSDFSAAAANSSCSTAIRASWGALDRVAGLPNNTGVDLINKQFSLCEKSRLTAPANVTILKAYLTDLWTNLAMMDYPYPTNFLAPLPANPVLAACLPLATNYTEDQQLLGLVYQAASVYFNTSGEAKCLDLGQEDDIGADMWGYQACTEMVMPFCYDGSNDMFEPAPWDLAAFSKECMEQWGVGAVPDPDLANRRYGGRDLQTASNIVFSNGLLDPWSSGGLLKAPGGKGVLAVIIPEGAHHLDLRAADPADPVSVQEARKQERAMIGMWVQKSKPQGGLKP